MTSVDEEAIRLYALYGQPHQVFKKLKEIFGDDAPTAVNVQRMREKYRTHILKKRKELQASIPIMDPEERWIYLQNIIDSALEGDTTPTVTGAVNVKVDRPSALAALRLAQEMTEAKGVVTEENDDYIRSIVMEAYRDMRDSNPKRSDRDILNEILMTLGDQTRPYVEELYELTSTSESTA